MARRAIEPKKAKPKSHKPGEQKQRKLAFSMKEHLINSTVLSIILIVFSIFTVLAMAGNYSSGFPTNLAFDSAIVFVSRNPLAVLVPSAGLFGIAFLYKDRILQMFIK
jgi:hypothetical protein